MGFELAGLDVLFGKEHTNRLLIDKQEFLDIRHNSLFHTIYTNDMFQEANQTYKNNFPSTIYQHQKDIRKVKDFPKCDIVLGGFPCPGFSEAGRLINR